MLAGGRGGRTTSRAVGVVDLNRVGREVLAEKVASWQKAVQAEGADAAKALRWGHS